jgi:hypothetical protein
MAQVSLTAGSALAADGAGATAIRLLSASQRTITKRGASDGASVEYTPDRLYRLRGEADKLG